MLGEGSFGQVWKCEAENIDGNKGVVSLLTVYFNFSSKRSFSFEDPLFKG